MKGFLTEGPSVTARLEELEKRDAEHLQRIDELEQARRTPGVTVLSTTVQAQIVSAFQAMPKRIQHPWRAAIRHSPPFSPLGK